MSPSRFRRVRIPIAVTVPAELRGLLAILRRAAGDGIEVDLLTEEPGIVPVDGTRPIAEFVATAERYEAELIAWMAASSKAIVAANGANGEVSAPIVDGATGAMPAA